MDNLIIGKAAEIMMENDNREIEDKQSFCRMLKVVEIGI